MNVANIKSNVPFLTIFIALQYFCSSLSVDNSQIDCGVYC